MTVATPLSVSGRFIVDAHGNRVKLCGVNWAGAHQDDMTPGGLDYRHRDQIATQIAAWGFNSVRLPFALTTVTATAPVPASLVAANRDLEGGTPWQVYQACVRALTGAGLMVIPNCHLLFRGWCCSDSDGNGLWWNGNWPSSRFTSAWLTVAAAFGCVVYSVHDYAWFHPSGQPQAGYISSMDAKGGYLLTGGIAPVWVGEFGTGNDTPAAVMAGAAHGASSPTDWNLGTWFSNFLAWAKLRDVDWCLWLLDGTMRKGTTTQTNQLQFAEGDRSGYGLFAQDWSGVSSPALLEALQSIMPATLGPGSRPR